MRETFRGLKLDRFQQEALDGIARDENVIVAAPTGAGKTLIAHYAIERALAEGRRAVYTAPIKALSNQKYRDLSEAYPGQVGISTGDISIDANAPVVVMTTEIFRNTIFDAPERVAEIAWVIFDEVHYLDDPDRGTVWEESLIFAPPSVRILALSATVSNLDEFADWMREVRNHPVRVTLEKTRPVPLEVFVSSTEGRIRPLARVDELRMSEREMRSRFRKRSKDLRRYYEQSQLDLVHEIAGRGELPLLFFLFSRAGCERLAAAVASREDLQSSGAAGKAARDELFRLADAFSLDLADPDLKNLVGMVERGVAYHHAGVIPALKEVVERLFGAGHIKLLCATETFALGVNMPARSVAFEGVMRWNGKARVPLMTRQYQQMAGRAGRRGIDESGSVYLTYDPFRDETRTVTAIVNGIVEPVRSQFDLSYGTLLNLYRRLGDELFAACEKSFANFSARRGGARPAGEESPRDDSAQGAPGSDPAPGSGESGAASARAGSAQAGGTVRRRASRDKRGSSVYERAREHSEGESLDRVEGDRVEGDRSEGGRSEGGRRGRDRRGKNGRGSRRGRRERQEQRGGPGAAGSRDQRRRRDRYESVVEQVRRKIGVLTELGYIDSKGQITRQGRFAMQVFGHELELSEIVFSRALEGLSAEQIAVVAASIVFESRSGVFYGGPEPQRVVGKQTHRLADKAVAGLVRLEEERGIKQGCKRLDWSLSGAVWAWVQGAEFSELRELSDASDGDVVRSLRQTIQILRLAVEPLRKMGEEALAEKFRAAQGLLKRDLVDAEWQLRRAAELERAGLSEADLIDSEDEAGDESDEGAGPDDAGSGDAGSGDAVPEDESDEFSAGLRSEPPVRPRRRLDASDDMLAVLPAQPLGISRGPAPRPADARAAETPAEAVDDSEDADDESDEFSAGLL